MELQSSLHSQPTKHRSGSEWLALVIALTALITARLLTPSATGTGTHEQLGLPACPLLHLTGVPCPMCGFTTSFAYGVRGQLWQAILTQPAGFVIFCLTVLSLPASVYLVSQRRSWGQVCGTKAARVGFYVLLAIIALGWVYKIVAIKKPGGL